MKASDIQIGGDHYKGVSIQCYQFCTLNRIPFTLAGAIKYVTRHRKKGGLEDLKKAMHYIDLHMELLAAGELFDEEYVINPRVAVLDYTEANGLDSSSSQEGGIIRQIFNNQNSVSYLVIVKQDIEILARKVYKTP